MEGKKAKMRSSLTPAFFNGHFPIFLCGQVETREKEAAMLG